MSTPKAQFAEEQTEDGEFVRQEDAFRDFVSNDRSTPYPAEPGRYHLYVSLACPWAHRTLIVRQLKNLSAAVGVTVVDPVRDEKGWAFRDGRGQDRDPVENFRHLSEAYLSTRPGFRGRWTVPVLWDKATHRIVNNSEDDICRMFNSVFAPKHTPPDLFPETVAAEQTALSTRIYETVNNGVYRAGFATSQAAHERAVRTLFAALDELDARLADRRHLLRTPEPVETDWRLFCTLVRFDAVYHGHFKCNLRRIADYPDLHGYLRDLYQRDGVAATVDFDHIKRHYYLTHSEINPSRIVPLGPLLDLRRPHGRERLR